MIGLIQSWLRLAASKRREKAKSATRSPKWDKLRDATVKAAKDGCAACGSFVELQVHHIQPFHLYPDLELEPKNLIVLCMEGKKDCHLLIGHGGNFKKYNPKVLAHAAVLRSMPAGRPLIEAEAKAERRD